jgi:hypothetical protein
MPPAIGLFARKAAAKMKTTGAMVATRAQMRMGTQLVGLPNFAARAAVQ